MATDVIWIFTLLILSHATFLYSFSPESHYSRRINAHLLIGDPESALKDVRLGLSHYPDAYPLHFLYVKILAAIKDEREMMKAWSTIAEKFPNKAYHQELLEEIAWAIVNKGAKTSALAVKAISLLAASITQDARGLPILIEAMTDSNTAIRAMGVDLASHFGDQMLKEKIIKLFHTENNFEVRLNLAKSIGTCYLEELIPVAIKRLADRGTSPEEIQSLIQSIASINECIDHNTLVDLSHSNRATLRLLASECIGQLNLIEEADLLLPLLKDSNYSVRVSAIKGIGSFKKEKIGGKKVVNLILDAAKGGDHFVGIAAGFSLLLLGSQEGRVFLTRCLKSDIALVRSVAAGAISASGPYGIDIAREMIDHHTDPFVRANLALGLIGQRVEVEKGCQAIEALFKISKENWMWKRVASFESLQKSDLRHNSLVPNFPEIASYAVHLDLLNVLAICDYEGALTTIKDYLFQKKWEITSIAAEMLLGEGDENAVLIIRKLLDDTNPRVRLDAALTLAVWGHDYTVLPVLIELYEKGDKLTRIKILEAVGRLGDSSTLPFLMSELQNSSQTLRVIAAACILMSVSH
ncbi:MAG: HEAT repeat domain-containing protein [Chlamydiia bacterium]|nr:HEAT repeat domain-containing protein [Chlamydiia bacterium]